MTASTPRHRQEIYMVTYKHAANQPRFGTNDTPRTNYYTEHSHTMQHLAELLRLWVREQQFALARGDYAGQPQFQNDLRDIMKTIARGLYSFISGRPDAIADAYSNWDEFMEKNFQEEPDFWYGAIEVDLPPNVKQEDIKNLMDDLHLRKTKLTDAEDAAIYGPHIDEDDEENNQPDILDEGKDETDEENET